MKYIFKKFMYFHLFVLIKILFWVRNPIVVLVVGSSNKSMLKEKLKKSAIKKGLSTRKEYRPYNTWFGAALNVMDLPSAYSKKFKWFIIYFLSFYKFLYNLFFMPKYLFIEGGIDESGEAKSFLNLLKPKSIIFGSMSYGLDDDFKKIDMIEKEYYKMVSYLNKKSQGYEKYEEEGNLEDIIDMLSNRNIYVGVINKDYEKLQNLGEKLIRKLYISE